MSGYTKTKADGWGAHGSRQFGIVDGANIRFETLVTAELGQKVLQTVAANFSLAKPRWRSPAYVDAVPSHHFS